MECFCGCGERVQRGLTDANLRLSEVSLDLLAWDKYRTNNRLDPVDFVAIDRLVARGAGVHRRLLVAVHEKSESFSLVESDEWLADSRAGWNERDEMTERGSLLSGRKLRFTEDDLARIDRVHPDRSFSGDSGTPAEIVVPAGRADDVGGQLERLRSLRAEGVLSEDEFRAAAARLAG